MMETENREELNQDIGAEVDLNQNGLVSVIHNCQSVDAKKLCIHDALYKLKQTKVKIYDIGGTYTGTESDLWFYVTTSQFSEKNYLLNLFVCHRKVGDISITISYNGCTSTQILKSSQPNQNYHLKTFCITDEDLRVIGDHTLFIPITIDTNPTQMTNQEVIKKMKLQHSLSEHLMKNVKTDFILISASKTEFPVHKIVLAAHSPILREIIKDPSKTSEVVDVIDEDMELLMQFLYTGSITNIQEKDCMRLQEIAVKFQLSNLFLLAQYAISEQINVENAVHIALIAKKYKLEKLWAKACTFIRRNPKVMETDGWKTLEDIELAKQLCMSFVK